MESAVDSPAIALFNTPTGNPALRVSPRHFVTRSLRNIRQGNFPLLIVFVGCLVIFVRALFGAGYDEGYSAQADAASAKHPSLLARWGSQPQHAIEAQWKKLHEKRSASGTTGLWAKIRKEDERVASSTTAQVPGADALHWLRVMEDKALTGLGRKPRPDIPLIHEQEHDVAVHEAVVYPQVPVSIPEHAISEDLDEHDVHDDDEKPQRGHSHGDGHVPKPAAPHGAYKGAPLVAPSDDQPRAPAPSSPDARVDSSTNADALQSSPSSSEPAQELPSTQPPPPPASHDPEHDDDTDDEPIYLRDEHR